MKTTKIGNACKAALAVAITGSLFAGTAQAQLAGHNVILVHGFQQQDLANPPAKESRARGEGSNIDTHVRQGRFRLRGPHAGGTGGGVSR